MHYHVNQGLSYPLADSTLEPTMSKRNLFIDLLFPLPCMAFGANYAGSTESHF